MFQLDTRRRRGIALAVLLCAAVGIGLSTASITTGALQVANSSEQVTEERYIEPAPEPGDEYFEAEASDGRWVSYVNPRDEYRSPYLGDGSGKICTVLLNEAGEPIVGDTVPNTTVTIPTGDSIEWHSHADPMTVEYPLTEHYDRPLDADQFGTADDVAQGDGYMDSHCIEFHGPAIGETIEYGQASVDGEHADRIDVVGYIQQDGDAWESDIDPVDAAASYEEAGGGWTFHESESHGQVVVVLELGSAEPTEADSETSEAREPVGAETNNETDKPAADDETPGFGLVGTVVALVSLVVGSCLRRSP